MDVVRERFVQNKGGMMITKLRVMFLAMVLSFCLINPGTIFASKDRKEPAVVPEENEYTVGVEDVLDISVLQPETMNLTVTVTPDGSITFPYIGKVMVNDKTPSAIQEEIQKRLADGYLKYPVVAVALRECRSKKFYVYGEVVRPGTYLLEDNMTVLKAISNAGGLTKYGSLGRILILRPKTDSPGYVNVKVNMDLIMNGISQDIPLEPGDIVQVKEGVF